MPQSLDAELTVTEAIVPANRATLRIHAHVIVHTWQQSRVSCAYLGGVCTACKIGHHIDRRRLIWKLNKSLVFVSSDIEFALHQSAKRCAKLSQLLLCGLVRQISDMEHLQPRLVCVTTCETGMCSSLKGQSVLPAGCTRHYRYLGRRLCVSVHSISHAGTVVWFLASNAPLIFAQSALKQGTDTHPRGFKCLVPQTTYTLRQHVACRRRAEEDEQKTCQETRNSQFTAAFRPMSKFQMTPCKRPVLSMICPASGFAARFPELTGV